MSEKDIYGKENIKTVEWYEPIRLRPAMYIGSIDNKGFIGLIKNILIESCENIDPSDIGIKLKNGSYGEIILNNIKGEVEDRYAVMNLNYEKSSFIGLDGLNALCENLEFYLCDLENKKLIHQRFEYGVIKQGEIKNKSHSGNKIKITFQLDRKIWSEDFRWNKNFIIDEIKELANLYNKVKFELEYESLE